MLDSVTINQLRTFVAVCDEGSFSGAARALKRAQSAVSHAVAALESALDVPLFERDARRAELSVAGRSLLRDARAIIARTEEMKTRAGAIARAGAPCISVAVDVHFPRAHLIDCLRALTADQPTASVDLRMTTLQGGEDLLLSGSCSLAVTDADMPERTPGALERHWLCDVPMVTVCAPVHPLAASSEPIPPEEFGQHVQLVVTDRPSGADRPVPGERRWLLNDLGAKHDFLRAGLCWGDMPTHLVRDDLRSGRLVELRRRTWHAAPMNFAISRKRGHELSPCEADLIDLLAAAGAYCRRLDASRQDARQEAAGEAVAAVVEGAVAA